MTPATLLALAGVLFLASGLSWPRGLLWGALLYLGAALADALAKGPLSGPAQVALLLGGLLALRGETLFLRPRLSPLRRYLVLLALLLGLFALKALPHPGGSLPLALTLLHGGAFVVAYLALAVGVGAGVMCGLQDRWLRLAPERAVRAAPLWSLRRLERGYLKVGYLATTLGLGSGMAWAWGYFGSPLALDPKEVSVLLGWLLLTLYFLLEERLRGYGRVGWLLLAYALLLFAFLGAPFLGSRHPSRLPL
ncbi:MAG: cytochrome c biogenesis protein [Thermus sp.]|uniref:cytochrome c biogenesis protein CcsA n=1 Tax=Thermus sp. TaxID=275 RepID=UPI0025E3B027|nr:cytochrome c biogenesis protein CcsA [Thermus sp.]MCS6868863.1 cytochrome c biogenesis protein [Thermus sp.]MCS7218417.1 cytochrome c biogenesis protein [Thermus sp.]MCX7849261.1 cytochrome c biogenesis protein [Thermus sp.]MDW8016828.1 cytochrome c biogenesis protein CcsA [Thermus sp.]MDW8356979.1 cytochrome c biogenesis protein CcsA [Thermus sp.]